ncbi:MAG: 4-hydroxy-3-methylbut-2-enyl diphosphate reductase, partial [Acidimicrobiaceae bacterium]
KFPNVWSPGKSDLCFATTNRQRALMKIAEQCDAIIVIGSDNSSNTRALEKLAREVGCENVYRVNDVSELPKSLKGVIGITAGASAPEELVDQIIAQLAPTQGVEEIEIAQEDEYFPPPRHIRQLQTAIETVLTVMLGGELAARKIVDDRKLAASTVLALLAS